MRYPILLLCFFFYACNAVPRDGVSTEITSGMPWIDRYEMKEGGMRYIILKGQMAQGISITTINLTKDSLECEYYKQQLNKK